MEWGDGKVGSSGPGIGLSYTAPRQTLRITGAPRTKFSREYTVISSSKWNSLAAIDALRGGEETDFVV